MKKSFAIQVLITDGVYFLTHTGQYGRYDSSKTKTFQSVEDAELIMPYYLERYDALAIAPIYLPKS